MAPSPVRFGPERTALAPALVVLVGATPLALSARPLLLLYLVPLVSAVWVLRARVVVRPDVLEVCNGLRVARLPWPQVEGFDVPRRGWVRVLADGRRLPLTALRRAEVRALLRAGEQVSRPAA